MIDNYFNKQDKLTYFERFKLLFIPSEISIEYPNDEDYGSVIVYKKVNGKTVIIHSEILRKEKWIDWCNDKAISWRR